MTALQRRAAGRAARYAWTYLLVCLAAVVLSCDKGVLDPGPSSVALVEVSPETATIQVGTTLQLNATALDDAGTQLGGRTVFWASENEGVATVSGAGVVTGVAAGTTRIGASVEGTSAFVTIIVTDQPVAEVTITPNIATVGVRASIDLVAATRDGLGNELPGREVRWASGDTNIATVNSGGRVTGVAPGNVVIVAESEGKSDTAAVTVTPAPVGSVVVSPTAASLTTGQTTQLTWEVRDPSGAVLTDRPVVFTSDAEGVATVSSTGLVTGVAAGAANVIATVEGVSDTTSVTVVGVPVSAVVVSPASSSVIVGGTVQLAATPVNAQGAALPGRAVAWASGDPAVATVNGNGVVTGVSAGTVTITATSEGKTGAASVTVSNIPVATVVLTPTTASVMAGDSVRFTAQARSSNGTVLQGRTVAWQSSNNSVATVNSAGWVVGVGAGTATITATSEGKSDQSTVTVTRQPVASITISPPSITVAVGQTSQLTAVLKDSKGNVLTGREVRWSSNRTADATVSSSGMVRGVSVGSATITATSEGESGTAAVTVEAAPVSTVIVSPANALLYVGQTRQLSVQVTDANGAPVSTAGTTWQSSNAGVATVSASGVVTAVGPGTADITATNGGLSGKTTVTVQLVPVASVLVSPSPASVVVGRTVQLTAQPRDADGNALTGRDVTWSSNDPDIAKVDGNGLVTGVSLGTAVITATSGGRSGSSAVTVRSAPVARVVISPDQETLSVGESGQFSVTLFDDQDAPIPLAGRSPTWYSSNLNVALVSSTGLATGRAPGTARIIVALDGKADTANVTVVPVAVASVSVTPGSATINVGQTVDFNAQPRDADGNALSGRAVTWTSSNTAVATVNGNGLVTGVAAGSATITAASEGATGTATVTVNPVPVASVDVSPSSATLTVGQQATLTAQPQDAAGRPLENRAVQWSSSNANVATVSQSGVVTAVAPGAATITATSEGRTGTATIAVSQIPVASVRVSPATLAIDVGRTGQLRAEPLDGSGNVLPGRVVVWTSTNESVATVDDDGVVTGVAAGTATIRATSEGKTGTAAVTVTPVAVQTVTVSPASGALIVGETLQLGAVAKDEGGNTLAGRPISWTTSNADVATVSGTGLVTAVAPGSATITATSEGKSGTSTITVSPVPVASVEVTPSNTEVVIGRTVQLAAQPRDAEDNALAGREVAWSSSDPEVATVDQNGVVTGVAEGTARITATSEGKSGAATVAVRPAAVATITLSTTTLTLVEDEEATVSATLRDDQGNELAAAGRTIEWSSSDQGVATVSSSGRVRGRAPGTATITATSEGRSANATVTTIQPPVASVSVAPSSETLDLGETLQLTATPRDARGEALTGRDVVWSSSNESVATVSQLGEVNAVAPGEATITATSEERSGTAQIVVSPPPVSSVTVEPDTDSLVVGTTLQLAATPRDASGGPLQDRDVGWRSSDTGVATVSGSGLVTAVREGAVTITATSEGRNGTASIKVLPPPAARVVVSPKKLKLDPSEQRRVRAEVYDARGVRLLTKQVRWRSIDEAVARVSDDGVVTGVSTGETEVIATVDGVSDRAQVEVDD